MVRRTATASSQVALQQDLNTLQTFLDSIGLSLATSKCKTLNVAFGSHTHALVNPLTICGTALPEVSELRWLGLLLDRHLSLVPQWRAASASAKRATGALSRLVQRNPVALRHLLTERVSSSLLHALPYAQPATQAGWATVNGVTSYAAHLLSNTWHINGRPIHGFEVMELAGVTSASEVALTAGLRFMYKCVKGARRFGQWLQHPPAAMTATRASTHRMVHEITLPPTQLHSFDNFGLIRIIRAWNSLLRLPTFRPSDLDSISTFNSALLTCLPLLPTPIRKSYGLPPTSST